MKRIHLAKFSFGKNIYHDIVEEELNYYQSFFSDFFGAQYTGLSNSSFPKKTIPISYKKLSDSSSILETELLNFMKNENIIDNQKKLLSSDDLLIVDIKYSFREGTKFFMLSLIEEILNNQTSQNKIKFVIILEDLKSGYQNLSFLNNHIQSGNILLLDKKKRFKYLNNDIYINKKFSFNSFTKSPLNKTKLKFIRKIGHYVKYKNEKEEDIIECNTFFYDGANSVNDLLDVLFHKILDYGETNNIHKIIYDSLESPWLDECILLLDTELMQSKNEYKLNYLGYEKAIDLNKGSDEFINILLTVDFVHTGSVLKRKTELIMQKFPNANLQILTILLVEENKHLNIDKLNGTAELELSDSKSLHFEYLLGVEQIRYEKFGKKCPMCNRIHLDKYRSDFINTDVLTSFEAWTMCDEAGYIPEKFSVDREKPFAQEISLKPDTRKLIEKNSAYLAIKYADIIKNNSKLNSSDLVIVFPDETSNKNALKANGTDIKLEETASGYFAQTLLQLNEIEFLGIPREILDRIIIIDNEIPNLSFIQDDFPEFYNKLRFLTEEIIIMDEFGFSGGTLKKIIAVLKYKGKQALAYFPIFNFGPKKNLVLKDISMHSLYEFDIHQINQDVI